MPAKKKTKPDPDIITKTAAERFTANEGTSIRQATPAELEIIKRLHAGERPINPTTNEQ